MNKKILLLVPVIVLVLVLFAFCGKTNDAVVDPTIAPGTENVTATDPSEIVETVSKETVPATEAVEESEPEATTAEKDKTSGGFGTGSADEPIDAPNKGSSNEQQTTPTSPEASLKPEKPQSCGCEYERYLSMSAADQQAYMNSFASMEEFISWSKSAAAAHDGHNTGVTVEGGNLNIGDYIG